MTSRSLPRVRLAVVLALALSVLTGCVARRLVPITDGAVVDPERKSASRTEAGVTVTVRASAWRGPRDLERYATPFRVTIRNQTETAMTFALHDLALFDERRRQYSALSAADLARVVQSEVASAFAFGPLPRPWLVGRPIVLGHHFVGFRDPFVHPFFWWGPVLPPAPPRVEEIVTEALVPGVVRPRAHVEGFVYFARVPSEVRRVTVEVGFEITGELGRREMVFPFALDSGSASTPRG